MVNIKYFCRLLKNAKQLNDSTNYIAWQTLYIFVVCSKMQNYLSRSTIKNKYFSRLLKNSKQLNDFIYYIV